MKAQRTLKSLRRSLLRTALFQVAFLGALVSASLGALSVATAQEIGEDFHYHDAGRVLQLVTEEGEIVTEATVGASEGDIYINQENDQYIVRRVEGNRAIVEHQGKAEMPDVTEAVRALERAAAQEGAGRAQASRPGLVERLLSAVGRGRGADVGIYHTHNAESYRPTSGVEFKDRGDIYEVGRALKEEFEKRGFTVEWSENSHLPHDGQAYLRSRRTASQISRKRPTTIIDVHRDAIPRPEEYRTEVNGTPLTQVRLVVGRQNQNREANLEYAKQIKAIADEKYPGLIKGIYHARGNYNQDLGPRMMLLEFGSHVTGLEEALRSVPMMAEVIAAAAGLTPGAGGGRVGSAGGRTALWILVIAAIAGVGWFLLNKEGLGGLRRLLGKGPQDGGDLGQG